MISKYTKSAMFQLEVADWKEEKVPPTIKETFFRIAQEQLSNIYKHARATEVIIQITSDTGVAALTVKDNGVGFDPCEKKDGIGLSNIRSRAECCEGTAQFISAPGKGCTLLVNVPLDDTYVPGGAP